jgi:hypothetical protein
MVDSEIALGDVLRDTLTASGWKIVNSSPLPVVCFTHALLQGGTAPAESLLSRVYEDGTVWISGVTIPHYGFVLRACIINYRTTKEDIVQLVAALDRYLAGVTVKI